jgi:hypothetical protein
MTGAWTTLVGDLFSAVACVIAIQRIKSTQKLKSLGRFGIRKNFECFLAQKNIAASGLLEKTNRRGLFFKVLPQQS